MNLLGCKKARFSLLDWTTSRLPLLGIGKIYQLGHSRALLAKVRPVVAPHSWVQQAVVQIEEHFGRPSRSSVFRYGSASIGCVRHFQGAPACDEDGIDQRPPVVWFDHPPAAVLTNGFANGANLGGDHGKALGVGVVEHTALRAYRCVREQHAVSLIVQFLASLVGHVPDLRRQVSKFICCGPYRELQVGVASTCDYEVDSRGVARLSVQVTDRFNQDRQPLVAAESAEEQEGDTSALFFVPGRAVAQAR